MQRASCSLRVLTRFVPDGNMNRAAKSGPAFCRCAGRWRPPQQFVPKWRNWQTRYIQGVVPVRAWRFESSLRHHDPSACHFHIKAEPGKIAADPMTSASHDFHNRGRVDGMQKVVKAQSEVHGYGSR